MGEMATSLAIVNPEGFVETFVRLDVPAGWSPPDGYTAVPDDELPEGWQRVPVALEPVPASVSARQIRLWLIRHGVPLASVEQAIDGVEDQVTRETIRVEWEYAPYVERSHPWLESLGAALGLDAAAIDQAFREAAVI